MLALEREGVDARAEPQLDVYFVVDDAATAAQVLAVMADLRGEGISCDTDYAGRSLKGQLTQAQKRRAPPS